MICSRNGFETGRWRLLLALSLAGVIGEARAQPSRPDWAGAAPVNSAQVPVSAAPMDASGSVYTPQVSAVVSAHEPRIRTIAVSSITQTPVAPAAAKPTTPKITRTGMTPPADSQLSNVQLSNSQPSPPQASISQAPADVTVATPVFYERDRTEPLEPASITPDAQNGTDLIQLIEVLQWTVVVLMLAVVGALALKKFKPQGMTIGSTGEIKHLASLPVKNLFQAHLLEITGQQFFVTTDRNGVKTVTAVTRWDDFETPIDTFQESAAASAAGQPRS